MLKYCLLLLFTQLLFTASAQEEVNIIGTLDMQRKVEKLEHRINILAHRSPYTKHISHLKQYHIFELYAPLASIDTFFDDVNNMKMLSWNYTRSQKRLLFFPGKRYLRATTIVCDSLNKVVALADCRRIYKVDSTLLETTYKDYMDLVKLLNKKELLGAFYLGTTTPVQGFIGFTWYGVGANHFYILHTTYANGMNPVVIDATNKDSIINEISYFHRLLEK